MAGQEILVHATDGGALTAYLSFPKQARNDPLPGILMLPEIYNSNTHIRSVADNLAAEGFVTLAPDVFWRLEPGIYLPYTPAGQTRARSLNQRLDIDQLLIDLGNCITTLRSRRECSGKVGVTGFCLGGKLAYLCATRHDIDAAVCYYGVKIDHYLDEADKLICPTVLHFAGNDSHVPRDTVEAITKAIGNKPNVSIYTYPEAEHGFNRAGYPPYHAASAELARKTTLALFTSALRRPILSK